MGTLPQSLTTRSTSPVRRFLDGVRCPQVYLSFVLTSPQRPILQPRLHLVKPVLHSLHLHRRLRRLATVHDIDEELAGHVRRWYSAADDSCRPIHQALLRLAACYPSCQRAFCHRLPCGSPLTLLLQGGKYGTGIVMYLFYFLWRHRSA